MTKYYLADTLNLIKSIWPSSTPSQKGRKICTALEASTLVGTFGKVKRRCSLVPLHGLSTLVFYCLCACQKKETLRHSSPEFKRLVEITKCKKFSPRAEVNKNHESIVRHALKKAARTIHHSPTEYTIVPSMREEIEFFQKFLEPDSGVFWQAPIAHLIKKDPNCNCIWWCLPRWCRRFFNWTKLLVALPISRGCG